MAHCAFENGSREEALDIFSHALERWPQALDLHKGFGYVSYHLGHYQAALNAYYTVFTIDPEERDIRLYITNVGRAALRGKNYPIAWQAFTYLQRIEPGHSATTGGLCQSLVGLKQMSEALPWCQQAVQASPKHLSYLAQLALVQLRLEQPDQALPWAQRAVALSPTWGFAHRLLGDIYCATGALPQAVTAYQKALERHPRDAAIQQRLKSVDACKNNRSGHP